MSLDFANELFPVMNDFERILSDSINIIADALHSNERIVIAYSAGKDSNTVFDLVYQYFGDYIDKIAVYSLLNPLEPPVLREIIYLKAQCLPIMLYEAPSWLDVMFEKGYLFPTTNMRWCTGVTKISPTKNFKELKGKILVGTRMYESSNRKRLFEKDSYVKKGIVTPIKCWRDEHIWYYLLNVSPLKDINRKLFSAYNNANTKRMGCILCPMASRIYCNGIVELHQYVYFIANELTHGSGYERYCDDVGFGVYRFKQKVLERLLHLIRQAERNCNIRLLSYSNDEAFRLYELGVQKRLERKRMLLQTT